MGEEHGRITVLLSRCFIGESFSLSEAQIHHFSPLHTRMRYSFSYNKLLRFVPRFPVVSVGREIIAKRLMQRSVLNGYNCLLRSDLGFWDKLVRERMPSSKFLGQEDEFAFRELTKNSTLPFFVTDIGGSDLVDRTVRTVIPITDEEANVTYYLIRRK